LLLRHDVVDNRSGILIRSTVLETAAILVTFFNGVSAEKP
jgi:hypothetical protein